MVVIGLDSLLRTDVFRNAWTHQRIFWKRLKHRFSGQKTYGYSLKTEESRHAEP